MAEELRGGDGLVVRVDDDGAVRVGWGEPDWFGPGRLSLAGAAPLQATALTRADGADALGAFAAVTLCWPPTAPVLRTALRVYRERPLAIFRLAAPEGIAGGASGPFAVPRVAWPAFQPLQRAVDGAPAGARTYGHQWAEFALPVFGDADGGGFLFAPHRPAVVSPLLLIAGDGRTLLLGALDTFHEQIIAVPGDAEALADGLRCGWHGDLEHAPPGFASELALWAAPSPRAALTEWTALLRQRAGTVRPSRYADPGLARLSYWTDNGAHYYYRTAPGADYLTTLERAVADCEARGLPIELVQIDSWFYPQEQPRPVSEAGAPIVPPSGMLCWEPRSDLFPDGFRDLRARLGRRPLAFHSRHFASASPYFARHAAWVDGAYAHPRGPELVDQMLRAAADWGAATYEQDWLVESFFGVRGLRAGAGRAREWQEALDAAASAHGLTLQWCMATPADFLQSVTLRHLTSIRTSGDYRYLFDNGLNWVWFLHVNALARGLGLNAFKDVFLSDRGAEPHAEVEALLAALGAGPVGIGDAIGAADRDLVRRTCREDGVLVKPDAPLAAIDRCFLRHGHLTPALLTGETLSQHGAHRWVYVATLHASAQRQALSDTIALADLGAARPTGPVIAYDWRRGTCARLAADGAWTVALDFQDWDFRVLCPLLPGERALIGDVARYATMGDRRIAGVAASVDALAFDVMGVPGTTAEVHGWALHTPHSVRATGIRGDRALPRVAPAVGQGAADVFSHDASGRWVVRVVIDAAGSARVTLA
ncbi:hypothetical protein KF840_19045 [bacterium]|nr:hypothetical protein [bacterium]